MGYSRDAKIRYSMYIKPNFAMDCFWFINEKSTASFIVNQLSIIVRLIPDSEMSKNVWNCKWKNSLILRNACSYTNRIIHGFYRKPISDEYTYGQSS